MSESVEIDGMDEAIARVEAIKEAIPPAAGSALIPFGGFVFAQSEVEVPKRTGALALSGHLLPLVDEGDGTWSISISYEGLDYTRIVHYNNRKATHLTGKAYFLIDPLHDAEHLIGDAVHDAVDFVIDTT